MMRDSDRNDQAVTSGDYLAGLHQWQRGLVGFQETLTSYFVVLTRLCHKICCEITLALAEDLKTFATEFNPPKAFLRSVRFIKDTFVMDIDDMLHH